MSIAVIVGAVAIGIALGMLGGGGSVLAVPLLVYVAQQDPEQAIATSLLVVGVTSAAATVPHARAGRVRWRAGLIFGGAAMVGAYSGGRVAVFIPGTWLLVAFALMMITTAIAMIRGRRGDGPAREDLDIRRMLGCGVVVGFVTGLVGAGGGFLVVPALVLFGGLPIGAAVGTSLLVIAMNSAAGLSGHLATVSLDWGLVLTVTTAALGGSIVGQYLVARIPHRALRKAFGWFVLAIGAVFLVMQAPPGLLRAIAIHPLATVVVAGALASVAATSVIARRRRSRQQQCHSNQADQRVAPKARQ